MIVGYPAGGVVDATARSFQRVVQEQLGQPILVENKPSEGGIVASTLNASATPDGYSLAFVASPTQTINPNLQKNFPFNPITGYTAISIIASAPHVLLVNKDLPITSLRELIAYAKANPGRLSFSSGGFGSGNHMTGEFLKRAAGIDLLHVPYKGGGPASYIDVVNGTVSMIFQSLPTFAAVARNAQVKALAVTSRERNRALPTIPTMIEAGIPDFNVVVWFGVEGPPNLPKPIVATLYAAVRKAVVDPSFSKRLIDGGYNVIGSSPEEMATQVKAENDLWSKIAKDMKIEN